MDLDQAVLPVTSLLRMVHRTEIILTEIKVEGTVAVEDRLGIETVALLIIADLQLDLESGVIGIGEDLGGHLDHRTRTRTRVVTNHNDLRYCLSLPRDMAFRANLLLHLVREKDGVALLCQTREVDYRLRRASQRGPTGRCHCLMVN